MTYSDLSGFLRDHPVPHAVLITGSTAEGRLEAARLVAQAAVCSGERPPCGVCRDCRKAARGVHPDITLRERGEDAREFTVDRVREIRAAAAVTPNEAARSVQILADADTLNPQAQNALLKVLEEPPGGAVLLLLAENTERLLPTVRSRCTDLRLDPAEPEETEAARETAKKLLDAVARDSERAILEAVWPWEKLDRTAFAEALLSLRRQLLTRLPELDEERFRRLARAADRADELLSANVSTGHAMGLLLAELVSRETTRASGPVEVSN